MPQRALSLGFGASVRKMVAPAGIAALTAVHANAADTAKLFFGEGLGTDEDENTDIPSPKVLRLSKSARRIGDTAKDAETVYARVHTGTQTEEWPDPRTPTPEPAPAPNVGPVPSFETPKPRVEVALEFDDSLATDSGTDDTDTDSPGANRSQAGRSRRLSGRSHSDTISSDSADNSTAATKRGARAPSRAQRPKSATKPKAARSRRHSQPVISSGGGKPRARRASVVARPRRRRLSRVMSPSPATSATTIKKLSRKFSQRLRGGYAL